MSLSPPLLLPAARKPRARKPPLARPKEIVLHLSVAKLLRDYGRADWAWTHVPNGELRDARTAVYAAKLKQMGVRRGWPDFILVAPSGLLHALELKRIGESLTADQEAFAAWCNANEVPQPSRRRNPRNILLLKAHQMKKRPGASSQPARCDG